MRFHLLFVFDVLVPVSKVWIALETLMLLLIHMLFDWRSVPILRLQQFLMLVVRLLPPSLVFGGLAAVVFRSRSSIVLVSYNVVGDALCLHVCFHCLVRIS